MMLVIVTVDDLKIRFRCTPSAIDISYRSYRRASITWETSLRIGGR